MGDASGPADETDGPGSADEDGEARGDVGEELATDPSEMVGLLGHLYRGQMDRVTSWRSRLDRTTYWAVTIMAAILTWAFSSRDNPHYLIVIGMATLSMFLLVETRRYRAYDVWRERVRLLERDLFAQLLDPDEELPHREWRERIGDDLRNPAVKVSLFRAFARRLSRVYYPLLLVLLAAWVVRITAFESGQSWRTTAAMPGIPGEAVVAAVAAFYLAMTAVSGYYVLWSPSGEFHERERTDPWDDE
ncbi:DUF2270 domain-containing protein [Halorussus salilacus]|uniref:DUF2270 domain-containing protein n=1 Tax=Halorussus salilacus TaxID=2953750 RepID=UPI00209FF1F5|nr:DUF2270 domain-containing protein [Halorussus salilacus]USZ67425.1 DUF2270 domain-containing protein [Halorussus salilacus]